MAGSTYPLDNAWQQARARLAVLEQWLDPGTIQHFESLGVGAGWHCLEIGAGGGSITEWLCRRTGPSGRVVATDIDTRFIAALEFAHLECRQHDLVAEPMEREAFDLVHTRAVLNHIGGNDVALGLALNNILGALRPGGWLLLEEMDNVSLVADPRSGERFAELLSRQQAARALVFQEAGSDMFYGRRLFGDLASAGVEELHSEARAAMVQGGTPLARFMRLTIEQVRDRLAATALVSAAEIDELCALMESQQSRWLSHTVVAVWGRRSATYPVP